MSRTEENAVMIKHFTEEAMKKEGTFEEIVAWHLGAMNSFLTDISKSLAVIADNSDRLEGE